MLAGNGYAQQTPASTPAAPTPAAPATTPKAPVKKTAPAAKSAAAPALATEKEKFSYALGMNIGTGYKVGLEKQGVEVDPSLLSQGVKDALSGAKTLLTEDEAKAVLNEKQTELKKQREEKAKKAVAEGEAFLAANKSKEGVVTLPSGLQYKILTAGTGPKPTASDTVKCNYRGTLIGGKWEALDPKGQRVPRSLLEFRA